MERVRKLCAYCVKEFVITESEQREALKKGGLIKRRYCRECLKRWRLGEIQLDDTASNV